MSLIFAGLSALLYGIADFSGGFSSHKNSTFSVVIVSQAAGIFLALAALALSASGLPTLPDILWGMLGGLCGALGLFTLYRGIATSIVAVVSPASALVSAVIPLAFGLLIGERPSALALAGAALCLPAVLLLSSGGDSSDGKSVKSALAQGAIAGAGFGFFFVAVSRSSPSSGLWPLVAARGTSVLIALSLVLIRREKIRIAKGSLPVTLLAGLADMGANIAFLLASRSGLLALASIVSSLYPAPTVILGRLVFKERIPPTRLAGFGLALVGVVLISLK
jgi:drug/metabolite transporter (DMT)-like permease